MMATMRQNSCAMHKLQRRLSPVVWHAAIDNDADADALSARTASIARSLLCCHCRIEQMRRIFVDMMVAGQKLLPELFSAYIVLLSKCDRCQIHAVI